MKTLKTKTKTLIKSIPFFTQVARIIFQKWNKSHIPFVNSERYWVDRYNFGGNSGSGSYGKLMLFKANIINDFVMQQGIKSVIEYGCGDGNQIKEARYSFYIGFDVSNKALELCKEKCFGDNTKTFKLMKDYNGETSQLTLSLDVIYHLVEDNIYEDYMRRLFVSAENFVIIYSSNNIDNTEWQTPHIKHRKFTEWVQQNEPHWKLISNIPNKYSPNGIENDNSSAEFFIYEKLTNSIK